MIAFGKCILVSLCISLVDAGCPMFCGNVQMCSIASCSDCDMCQDEGCHCAGWCNQWTTESEFCSDCGSAACGYTNTALEGKHSVEKGGFLSSPTVAPTDGVTTFERQIELSTTVASTEEPSTEPTSSDASAEISPISDTRMEKIKVSGIDAIAENSTNTNDIEQPPDHIISLS